MLQAARVRTLLAGSRSWLASIAALAAAALVGLALSAAEARAEAMPAVAASNPGAALAALAARADALHLADAPYWLRLLYWQPRWLRPARSMISSEAFFLAQDGRNDAHAELLATLRGLLDPAAQVRGPVPAHPSCAFPARRAWLQEQLHLPDAAWPKVACPQLDEWVAAHHYPRATLVFSSFYPDNPASMFGHTFLRLHRRGGAQASSALNDDAVNFSAQVAPGVGYLRYAWAGLSGGFAGRFSMTPYYFKIQEYNNLESRDLWEYPLALGEQDIDRLLLSLWEVGGNSADYLYFDQNCSFLLLALLETAHADLDLTPALRFWVTPSDALKVAVTRLATPQAPSYWASARSRYRQRVAALPPAGLAALGQLIEGQAPPPDRVLAGLAADERRQVLDAGLEYIDFKEKLGGTKQPKQFAQLRRQLLQARRQIPVPAQPLVAVPRQEQPALGHGTIRLGLGAERHLQAGASRDSIHFEWTPALHDQLSPTQGYGDGMAIEFMALAADYVPSRQAVHLEGLKLLSIFSLAGPSPLLAQRAWTFNLEAQDLGECPVALGDCWRREASYGEGRAADLGRARLYAMALGVLGSSTRRGEEAYLGVGPQLGAVWSPAPLWRVAAQANVVRRLATRPTTFWQSQAALAYSYAPNSDVRAAAGAAAAAGEPVAARWSLVLDRYF